MVESEAQELNEKIMLGAVDFGHKEMNTVIKAIIELAEVAAKEPIEIKEIIPEEKEYTKKVDVGNFVVDNTKLKKLGWKPKIELKVGIQKTMNYFKKEYSD